MSQDLPIYPDVRRTHRFPHLDVAPQFDLPAALERFDRIWSQRDRVGGLSQARSAMTEAGKVGLLDIHRALFHPHVGAGQLRQSSVSARFIGQDCPEPQFVDRALDNFEQWLVADSFVEIHPIEQAALSLTRLIDIWPFDFGNLTASVVFANFFLLRAGYPPFLVLPDEEDGFSNALSAAVRMQTEPLVQAIYTSILRELELTHE
jgi:fido (protein-threonine AMPylation protein)